MQYQTPDIARLREWRDGFNHGIILGAVVAFLLTGAAWIICA